MKDARFDLMTMRLLRSMVVGLGLMALAWMYGGDELRAQTVVDDPRADAVVAKEVEAAQKAGAAGLPLDDRPLVPRVEAPAALEKAAQRAYAALKHGDAATVLAMLSHEREFHLAMRQAVWLRDEKRAGKGSESAPLIHLMDDLGTYGWEERDLEFDLRSDTVVGRVRKAIGRFAQEVANTYGGVDAALQQDDAWHERALGPSAVGKMASDYFWHLYFRKEGKTWRIWKMELAVH